MPSTTTIHTTRRSTSSQGSRSRWLLSLAVAALLQVLRNYDKVKNVVHGIAHITGGGVTENLPRVLPDGVDAEIRLDAWPRGPLFELIGELATGVDDHELHRMLNMGIGMVAMVGADREDAFFEAVTEKPVLLGEVVPGDGTVHMVGEA